MTNALLFVLVRSVRGRIIQMVRRLKEPRYLFGFLVGAGWILFWMSRVFSFGDIGNWDNWGDVEVHFGPPPEMLEAMAGPIGQAIQMVIGLFLAIGLVLWWAIPFGRNSLEFTEPELHLLLPAPIRRRTLIQYGVLKSQPGVLIGVSITAFFLRPSSIVGTVATVVALWTFFTLWDLHAKARGLWYARLDALSAQRRWRNQIVMWVGLVAALVILAVLGLQIGFDFGANLPEELVAIADFDEVVDKLKEREGEVFVETAAAFVDLAWNSTLGWLLTPLVLLLKPIFWGLGNQAGPGWLPTMIYPLGILVAHNEWVVRSQARFEETALAEAKKRSRSATESANFWKRTRARRRWEPFKLLSEGRPEMAIVWKNLMMVQRLPLTIAFAVPVALLAVTLGLTVVGLLPGWIAAVLQFVGLAIMAIPPVFNARAMRNDFRHDLLRLEIMRTLPIDGLRLFFAQIAGPVIIVLLQVTFGIVVFLSVDALVELGLLAGNAEMKADVAAYLNVHRLALAPLVVIGYLPIALAVTSLTACLENVAALSFPGWVQLGADKKQAASKFGQHMLVFMALSIMLFAGLLPGVLTVGGIVAVQMLIWGVPITAWEFPILGLAGAIPVFAVVFALAVAGGNLWNRLDPSAELLAGRG